MKLLNVLSSFLLVVVMACAVGCASTTGLYQYHHTEAEANNQHARTIPLYLDKTFDKKELAVIASVIDEWNFVLNGYMTLKVEPRFIDHTDKDAMKDLQKKMRQTHEGIIIMGMDHDDDLVSDIVEDGDGVLAFVNGLGNRAHFMVVLRDRIGYKNLHKILLHEFGHAMGANHVEAVSLMYPYVGYQQLDCVDKITAAQVATHQDLDLKHLNYCATPNFE